MGETHNGYYISADSKDEIDELIRRSEKMDEFFDELFDLYDKYNVSIAHEDHHGAFIVEEDNKKNRGWIKQAHISNS